MLEIEVDDLHKLKEDKTVFNSRHDFVGLTMTAPNHLRGPRCTKNRHLKPFSASASSLSYYECLVNGGQRLRPKTVI